MTTCMARASENMHISLRSAAKKLSANETLVLN